MACRTNNTQDSVINLVGLRKKIFNKSAAIIGLGGIGCMTAQLLAREGIGSIMLTDKDKVEKSNLHRQILYDEKDIGKYKVDAAKAKLKRISPDISLSAIKAEIGPGNLSKLDSFKPDIILDCTDNLKTRLAINDYCMGSNNGKNTGVPWIFATAKGTKGMVCAISDKKARDWFEHTFAGKKAKKEQVLNTACNAIACIQATEAMKLLCDQKPSQDLILFDIWKGELRKIRR